MLTQDIWNENLIAYNGGDWGRKYARPHSDVRRGLGIFLFEYACGECVFCGKTVKAGEWEICHIISAGGQGNERRGFKPGNLGIGCQSCNQEQAEKYTHVPLSDIRNPAGIPTVWPRLVELRNAGKAAKAA